MSTSLHVLKNFWHQVNIRPAAGCFDWASVISVTAAEHGVNLVVTSCTRGLPCSCAAGDCSEDTLTAALHTWSVPPGKAGPTTPCHQDVSPCPDDNLSLNLLSSRFWTSVSVSLSLMTCNCRHLDPDLVAHRIAGHQS